MADSVTKKKKVYDFERKYVHDVYDGLAAKTSLNKLKSRRRGKCLDIVERFIKSFPQIALLADIGFGDGKYLGIHDGFTFGVEKSVLLCDPMLQQHENITLAADVTKIPCRRNVFDGLVCVAVIHHLATKSRRIEAIKELARILTPGGRLLLTVWAIGVEHKEFGGCDVLVPFKKNVNNNGKNKIELTDNSEELNIKNTAIKYLQTEFNILKRKMSPSFVFNEIQSKLRTRQNPLTKTDESVLCKENENVQDSDDHPTQCKYYHLFTRTELTELILSVSSFCILESYCHKGNLVFVLAKL